MSDTLIKVEGLYKKFTRNLKRSMLYGTTDVVKGMMGIAPKSGKLRKDEFWALQDINFELKRGETLGIIGANGSGKSTLLRVLNGIFPPDKGKVAINGRIGALIAVGAGFHPHMTGRENIYLNGTILGMTRQDIKKRFDEIVDFAEIDDFLDAPVSTYSSGMRVRLGFAIAAHVEPEILLVDEVLSVGDLNFRNKSLKKISEIQSDAKGIIFISHNLEHIRTVCSNVFLLERGKILFTGKSHDACVIYQNKSKDIRLKQAKMNLPKNVKSLNEEIEIKRIGLLNEKYILIDNVKVNDKLIAFCKFKTNIKIKSIYFSLSINNIDQNIQNCIWIVSNDDNKVKFENINKGFYRVLVNIDKHNLNTGIYILTIAIRNSITNETYQRFSSEYAFKVSSDTNLERGIVNVNEKWHLEKIKENL